MRKKYRFFTHYNKHVRKGSIHFRGECFVVDKVELIDVNFIESKTNKRQPYYVMQGYACGVAALKDMTTGLVTGMVYGK